MVSVRRHARNWIAYVACGGLGVAILLSKSSHRKIDAQQDPTAQQDHSYDLNQELPPGHAFRNYKHSSEAEHRTTEQFAWKSQKSVSFWTLVAAVIAVFLSVGSLYYTGRQANIAQQTLIASSRAWISPEIQVASATLTWQGDVPTIQASIIVTNDGNSPAIQTAAFPVLYYPHNGDAASIAGFLNSICLSDINIGNIVFMKESATLNSGATFDDHDFLEKKWLGRIRKKIAPNQPALFLVNLAVCASYHIIGDARSHQTVRLYDVFQSYNPDQHPVPIYAGQEVRAGRLLLIRQFDGEYAD